MMKYDNVPIRMRQEFSMVDDFEYRTLRNTPKDKIVPVCYKYAQGANIELVVDDGAIIGKAANIHIDDDGNLVCNVLIDPLKKLSSHFRGMIDNYLIGVSQPIGRRGELLQLVVYDADFKAKVDARLAAMHPTPGDGAIPMSLEQIEETNAAVKEAVEEITEPFDNDPNYDPGKE